MRTLTRKLLSLLLVFTMVCAMVPAAMAADTEELETNPPTEDQETSENPGDGTGDNEDGDGTGEGDGDITDPSEPPEGHTGEGDHKAVAEWSSENDKHWHACSVPDCDFRWDENTHNWGEGEVTTPPTCASEGIRTYTCVCGGTKTESIPKSQNHSRPSDVSQEGATAAGHVYTCTICNSTVSEAHTYDNSGRCSICKYENVASIDHVSISRGSFTMDINDKAVSLGYTAYDAAGNVTSKAGADVDWDSSAPWVADVSSSGVVTPEGVGKAVITLTVNGTIEDEITVTVDADADLEVTINEGMGTYYFGDEDLDGETLEDQLYEALDDAGYDDRYDDFDDLTFSISGGTSSVGTIDDDDLEYVDEFGKVEFTVKKAGTFTASFTIYNGKSAILGGGITINVEEGGSAGDIIYSAKSGDDVEFDVDDFEDFWDDNSSKGSLD